MRNTRFLSFSHPTSNVLTGKLDEERNILVEEWGFYHKIYFIAPGMWPFYTLSFCLLLYLFSTFSLWRVWIKVSSYLFIIFSTIEPPTNTFSGIYWEKKQRNYTVSKYRCLGGWDIICSSDYPRHVQGAQSSAHQ